MRTRYGDLTTDRWGFLVGGLRLQLASRQGNISTLWSSVRGFMEERKIHVSGGSVPSRDSVGREDIHSAVLKNILRILRTVQEGTGSTRGEGRTGYTCGYL